MPSHSFAVSSFGWGPAVRPGPGALVALAHVALVLALLHFAGLPDARHAHAPVDYIVFAFIPAERSPVARARPTPSPGTAPVMAAVTGRVTQHVTEHVTQHVTQHVTEHVAERGIERVTETVTRPVTEPVTEPATEPAAPAVDAAQAQVEAPAGRLDMQALRAAARLVDSARTPSALDNPRESGQMRARDDTDLSRELSKAKRPDCQTKYAQGQTSANVLLLIPLAIETIMDKGCKW